MSYTTVDIFTRPNTDVTFSDSWSSIQGYVDTTYIATGKLLSAVVGYSPDQLVQTITRTFVDQAAWQQIDADPVIIANRSSSKAYNDANGITHTLLLPN